jgi:hypothetical protein
VVASRGKAATPLRMTTLKLRVTTLKLRKTM